MSRQSVVIRKGDRVRVTRSDYADVAPGTESTVNEIRYNFNGKGQHQYILADLGDSMFYWRWELELAQ